MSDFPLYNAGTPRNFEQLEVGSVYADGVLVKKLDPAAISELEWSQVCGDPVAQDIYRDAAINVTLQLADHTASILTLRFTSNLDSGMCKMVSGKRLRSQRGYIPEHKS